MSDSTRKDHSQTTRTVRAALETDRQHGAVVPPLHLTSTFAFSGYGEKREYDYSRSGNPTRDALGGALAELEGGAGAVVTASGMAAVALVTQLLRPDQAAVVPHDCYGGTYRLFNALNTRGSLKVRFVDYHAPGAFDAALAEKPALVWIETPSNPLLRIVDIAETARKAKAVGALVVADNTFLSPVWQQPIALGADVVVHSTTKYLNGHSDMVGGIAVVLDDSLAERIQFIANAAGAVPGPMDSWLTLRGTKTLALRMRAHDANGRAVAAWLANRWGAERVIYPGLSTHPQHALAKKQMTGFGGMISVEMGSRALAATVLGRTKVYALAESLGGVESLISHPASMTHASVPPERRAQLGISDGLIRLSTGVEDVDDLIADLEQAFKGL